MSHTPGPWSRQGQWQLRTDTGDWVDAECMEAPKWGIIGAWLDASSDESEANARLVAAAPELLESCRRLLEIVEAEYEADECPEDLDSWRAAVQLASDAISKAEGRSE